MGATGVKRSAPPQPTSQPKVEPKQQVKPTNGRDYSGMDNRQMATEFKKRTGIATSRSVIDSMDNDNLAMTYEQLEKLVNDYPNLARDLTAVTNYRGSNQNTFAQHSYNPNNGNCELQLNLKYFTADKATLEQMYAVDVMGGFHPKGSTAKDIVWHETGHQVVSQIINNKYNSASARYMNYDQTAWDIVKSAYNSYATKPITAAKYSRATHGAKLGGTISRYAEFNPHETIAEAWVDYHCNGANAQQLSKAIYKELMKHR